MHARFTTGLCDRCNADNALQCNLERPTHDEQQVQKVLDRCPDCTLGRSVLHALRLLLRTVICDIEKELTVKTSSRFIFGTVPLTTSNT